LVVIIQSYSGIDIIPLQDDRTAVICLLFVYKIPDLRLTTHYYKARYYQTVLGPDNILDVMS